jgi:hypothetical protein
MTVTILLSLINKKQVAVAFRVIESCCKAYYNLELCFHTIINKCPYILTHKLLHIATEMSGVVSAGDIVSRAVSSAMQSVSMKVAFVDNVVSTAVSRVCDSAKLSKSSKVYAESGDTKNSKAMRTVSSMVRGLDADIKDMCGDDDDNEFLNFSEGIDRDIDKLMGMDTTVEVDGENAGDTSPLESPSPMGSNIANA